MKHLLKNLNGYQTMVDSVLFLTKNSLGDIGLVKGVIENGKISHFAPLSPSSIQKHIEIISETKKIPFEKTLRILPRNVWFFNNYGQYAGIVYVQPPRVHPIKVSIGGGKIHECKYGFPYTVFVYDAYQSLSLFFAFEEVGPKTPLYEPPLPNFYGESRACFGSVARPVVEKYTMKQLISGLDVAVYDSIYTGSSNSKVFKEISTLKQVLKYANEANKGKLAGKFESLVNFHITRNQLNLFE